MKEPPRSSTNWGKHYLRIRYLKIVAIIGNFSIKLIIAAKQIKINNGSKLFISFSLFILNPKIWNISDLKILFSKRKRYRYQNLLNLEIAPIDGTPCIAVTYFTSDSDVGDWISILVTSFRLTVMLCYHAHFRKLIPARQKREWKLISVCFSRAHMVSLENF